MNKRSTSPQILFNEISPTLGKYYQRLRLEFKDPEKALEALWGKTNEDGISYYRISSLLNAEELINNQKVLEDEIKECRPEECFEEWERT